MKTAIDDTTDNLLDIQESIAERFRPGRYTVVDHELLYAISGDEAIFLCYLMNKRDLFQAKTKYGGWFYCRMDHISKELPFFNTKRQMTIMKRLKDLGLLQIKKKGMPAKRFIFIDFIRLEQLIYEGKVNWGR